MEALSALMTLSAEKSHGDQWFPLGRISIVEFDLFTVVILIKLLKKSTVELVAIRGSITSMWCNRWCFGMNK